VVNWDSQKQFSQEENSLTVDQSATYRIQVVGHLDESWSSRLGGMTITSTCQDGCGPFSTLFGPIIDQAALFGVLNALYNMRFPLIYVECLNITPNR